LSTTVPLTPWATLICCVSLKYRLALSPPFFSIASMDPMPETRSPDDKKGILKKSLSVKHDLGCVHPAPYD